MISIARAKFVSMLKKSSHIICPSLKRYIKSCTVLEFGRFELPLLEFLN